MTTLDLETTRELSDFHKAAIVIALRKMFKGNHFDICVVRETAHMLGLGARLSGPDFNALHLMHCINWGDMGTGMAAEVQRKTLDLLGVNVTPAEVYEETVKEDVSLWKRLLSLR